MSVAEIHSPCPNKYLISADTAGSVLTRQLRMAFLLHECLLTKQEQAQSMHLANILLNWNLQEVFSSHRLPCSLHPALFFVAFSKPSSSPTHTRDQSPEQPVSFWNAFKKLIWIY